MCVGLNKDRNLDFKQLNLFFFFFFLASPLLQFWIVLKEGPPPRPRNSEMNLEIEAESSRKGTLVFLLVPQLQE